MPHPTGQPHIRPDGNAILFTRTFDLPLEEVWAAISESERTARWFGTFEGDAVEGHVMVSMNAEGEENTAPTRYDIERCDPPRLLHLKSSTDVGDWNLVVQVESAGAGSTLSLSHLVTDLASVASIGPGWEYYLDRLAAVLRGSDPEGVDWADYYPAMRPYYMALQDASAAG